MQKLDIRTMVLGPISTNTYICTARGMRSPGPGTEPSAGTDRAAPGTDPSAPDDDGPAGCFIVDPASDAPSIIEALGGCAPAAILLTHGHFDHLMAVNELRRHYPDIRVYAHPADEDIMRHPGRGIVIREFTKQAVTDFIPVSDGELLGIAGVNIEVIATPGHTGGGVCYYIPGEKVMFTGDTLFRGSYGRTDFESGDHAQLKDSIVNRLFARLKDEGHVDILPGHMEPTSSEYEMKYNPILTE